MMCVPTYFVALLSVPSLSAQLDALVYGVDPPCWEVLYTCRYIESSSSQSGCSVQSLPSLIGNSNVFLYPRRLGYGLRLRLSGSAATRLSVHRLVIGQHSSAIFYRRMFLVVHLIVMVIIIHDFFWMNHGMNATYVRFQRVNSLMVMFCCFVIELY